MEIPFDCIYLDFAKAFDRVSHQRLLTKLYNIGIRGNLMNWIKDFLKGREQRVVVNNEFSDWASVVSGIPQGSVLGPSLFTIFINDIPNDITSKVNFFVDYTKLYNSAVVVDLPLLRVAVEGSDNPISLEKPCQASLPPDQQGHHSLGRHPEVQYPGLDSMSPTRRV